MGRWPLCYQRDASRLLSGGKGEDVTVHMGNSLTDCYQQLKGRRSCPVV
jgi:hypothetical protein